jgi:hypothetical protein
MNTPAFQFYPGDWLKDPCLAQCSLATKGAWIELLAHMHESTTPGKLEGSYQNFARMCRCTEEEIEVAILELKNTKTATVAIHKQGSNVKVTVVNRRMFNAFKARQDAAIRQAKFRERKKNNEEVTPEVTEMFDTSNEKVTPYSSSSSSSSSSNMYNPNGLYVDSAGTNGASRPCPHQEIINLYHEILPDNPRVRLWSNARKSHLRSRWHQIPDLETWKGYFERVAESRFLTGQKHSNGERPFFATLAWLVKEENFAKVIEGNYDD